MKKGILAAALAACLLLSGCAALLERSFSLVEPYADRYWDSGAEDTMKVDNYQDLVNSLLMLIEQRAEEAVIRCYDEVESYQQVAKARSEVRWETMEGTYLLQNIQFTFEDGAGYGTAAFRISYREDAEDLSSVMSLSDRQSLADLLRLALREDHEKITARFTFDTPRDAVVEAVESFWQELCREEMDVEASLTIVPGEEASGEPPDEEGTAPAEEETEAPQEPEEPEPTEEDPTEEETGSEETEPSTGEPSNGEEPGEPEPEPIVYPPCPWTIRFYPNRETVELVEILLQGS